MTGSEGALEDKGRLLFGAGFAFGVACTLLIMTVVIATVTGETAREILASDVFLTIATGVFFAGVVGAGLYVLAFPENRLVIPVGRARLAETAARDASQNDEAAGADAPADGDAPPGSDDPEAADGGSKQ